MRDAVLHIHATIGKYMSKSMLNSLGTSEQICLFFMHCGYVEYEYMVQTKKIDITAGVLETGEQGATSPPLLLRVYQDCFKILVFP